MTTTRRRKLHAGVTSARGASWGRAGDVYSAPMSLPRRTERPRALRAPGLLTAVLALATAAGADPLPPGIAQRLATHHIPPDAVSIVVRDADTGETLLAHNPDVARSPASTLKVITTYAALDGLGPNYVWKTRALATGPVVAGHLRGDLVLQGGGDPYLTGERWERFARELRYLGIARVDGDVIVDDTLYAADAASRDDFDGRGFETYNVLPNALLVNLQTVEFRLVPGQGRIDVLPDPPLDNFQVINRVQALTGACRSGTHGLHVSDETPTQITIEGKVSVRCPAASLRRAVLTAPEFAYDTFLANFRAAGGSVAGHLKIGPAPAAARPLLAFESLTLGEIIRLVNKFSNNPMARGLLLTLAAERGAVPATVARGDAVVAQWLAERELGCPELVLDNGSGLSRDARVSAQCMTDVLRSAWKSRYAAEFAASLPLGGEDGTLRHRFLDTRGDARIRMKTGHLKNVAALAGWVGGASGRALIVAVFVNHTDVEYASGDALIDSVVRWALER